MKPAAPGSGPGFRITRRGFLWVAATVTGGLAVGLGPRALRIVRDRTPAPVLGGAGWIEIAPDGAVRLFCNATEMGQGAWSALAQVVAEELDADFTRLAVAMAPVQRPFYAPFDYATGGSRTVRGQFDVMRRLGAAARNVLVEAAARRWQVSTDECTTRDGIIRHVATGRRLDYGEVAVQASALSPPKDPPLKARSEWRVIGRSVRRAEVPAKVDGTAKFGLDLRLPGMRFAAIAHAPVPGGRLASLDEAPALSVPGVRRVMRLEDAFAVVADDTWAAMAGLSRLSPSWADGAHAGESSAVVREALRTAVESGPLQPHAPGDESRREAGLAAALLAAAGQDTIEATYEAPFLAHAPMEPMNATAWWHDGVLELWAPTQSQGILRRQVAERLDLQSGQVIVHTPFVGGGFGRRLETDYAMEAARLARTADHPLQVVWSREEDFRRDFFRPAAAARIRAALGGEAGLRAIECRVAIAGDSPGTSGLDSTPYRVPISLGRASMPRGVRTGAWRAVDASQNHFFRECFLDECAVATGRDPLDLRLGLIGDETRARGVLEAVARLSGWRSRKDRSLGLAFTEGWGSYIAVVAEARREAGGVRITRLFAAADCGTTVNPSSATGQVQGAIAMALSAAVLEEAVVKDGAVETTTFGRYPILRISGCPPIDVVFVESPAAPVGGLGELAVPPTAPAVANALFAATGVRSRRLPLGADVRLGITMG